MCMCICPANVAQAVCGCDFVFSLLLFFLFLIVRTNTLTWLTKKKDGVARARCTTTLDSNHPINSFASLSLSLCLRFDPSNMMMLFGFANWFDVEYHTLFALTTRAPTRTHVFLCARTRPNSTVRSHTARSHSLLVDKTWFIRNWIEQKLSAVTIFGDSSTIWLHNSHLLRCDSNCAFTHQLIE